MTKVGVLSFAHVHAGRYASLLHGMEGVEVLTSDPDVELAGPGEVRGRALADQLGVAYADTYEELFAWGPDAVVVATENARHRQLVELAASHGADVLCEKPLATSLEDGEAIIRACGEAGVRLCVAYPMRFSPAYAQLRKVVHSGIAGTTLSVAGANNGQLPIGARRWFGDPELAGGGALMDHTVHIADLLDDLFGEDVRVVEVYAQTNNLMYVDEVTSDTAGLVTVTYDNGAVATIDCSWSQPAHHPTRGELQLQLVGEKATVEMDAFGQVVLGFDDKRRSGVLIPWGTDLDTAMLRAFIFSEGSGGIRVADGEAGLRSLKVALAGYESVRTGQPVPVS
ncbi:Gfo/Idh/MocA family protein [Streptomyces sp. NPDC048639]|uniref:Gfo/Idh/MocA family protein n=1 Tax=Streptomyces sp. NPDC048639 TaxID=3365581 RepID=UPI00372093A6